MRIRLIRYIFFCLLASSQAHADPKNLSSAQDPLSEPRLESVGVGAIPRGVVATMAQDKAGFLWIATGDGLVRYDGYSFRPQELDSPDPATRNLGWIRALLPARDGRLWIGTESLGLAAYDPATDRVTVYRNNATKSDTAPTIRALAEDHEGAIWIGSVGGGLDRQDPASASITHYGHTGLPGSLPDDRVLSLLVDRQGTLWVGTWRGLSRRQRGSDSFEPVFSGGAASLGDSIIETLFEASDGRIWAGTQGGALAIMDPGTAQGTLLKQPADPTRTFGGAVSSFAESPGGDVWVGRATGIEMYDARDGRLLRRLRHDQRKPAGLAANEVTTLLRDRAGWIWVGGLGLGLQRHNPKNLSIRVRGADIQPGSAFEEPSSRNLLALDNGDVWVAAPGTGIAVMDSGLRVVGSIPAPSPGAATPMAQTRDGSVWLATESALYQYSHDRRQLRRLPHTAGPIHRLMTSSDGSLWMGTPDGLYRLRPGASTLARVNQSGGHTLSGDVFTLIEGHDGTLWVGTSKGLYRMAPGDSELQAVQEQAGAGLGGPIVIGLLIDHNQTLWLDTAVAGLHRMHPWDGKPARFDRISMAHGIVGRPYGANLLEDSRGRIWTQQYVYDPATDRLDELTAADGKDFGTGWFYSYAKLKDGRLLFGGSKGMLVIKPELYEASVYSPPLVVSELRLNGERQRIGQKLSGMRVEPEQRSFGIEFAALDYGDPGRIRYAYQLQGFDPDWINTGADYRTASYSNLRPGAYVLRVRATNRSGFWSENELAIPVRVLPAWWQQWWFRVLALGLLGAMLYVLMQLRTRQLRLRHHALELSVQQRTAELGTLARALQQKTVALEQSSLTDPLTGLRNRRFLTQHIDSDVATSVRRHEDHLQGTVLAADADLLFFMVDIDLFKEVNDQCGHAAGDAVLMQMRERLQQVFRDTDYMVRWGGEEFLIVARGSLRSHAVLLAERMRRAVADAPFVLDDGTLMARTCSLGFACFPLSMAAPRALDWTETVNVADAALYAAKLSGRNGWVGVVDAGTQDEEALRARPPNAEWLASGALTVQRS